MLHFPTLRFSYGPNVNWIISSQSLYGNTQKLFLQTGYKTPLRFSFFLRSPHFLFHLLCFTFCLFPRIKQMTRPIQVKPASHEPRTGKCPGFITKSVIIQVRRDFEESMIYFKIRIQLIFFLQILCCVQLFPSLLFCCVTNYPDLAVFIKFAPRLLKSQITTDCNAIQGRGTLQLSTSHTPILIKWFDELSTMKHHNFQLTVH